MADVDQEGMTCRDSWTGSHGTDVGVSVGGLKAHRLVEGGQGLLDMPEVGVCGSERQEGRLKATFVLAAARGYHRLYRCVARSDMRRDSQHGSDGSRMVLLPCKRGRHQQRMEGAHKALRGI